MKLKKLVKLLNKYLEEHPEDADLKVSIGRMGKWFYKERSLCFNPQRIRKNISDNTIYDDETDDYSETEVILHLGEI